MEEGIKEFEGGWEIEKEIKREVRRRRKRWRGKRGKDERGKEGGEGN